MAKKTAPLVRHPKPSDGSRELDAMLKELRARGLSMTKAAEQLDISHVWMSELRSGFGRPDDVLKARIEKWSRRRIRVAMWRLKEEEAAIDAQSPVVAGTRAAS